MYGFERLVFEQQMPTWRTVEERLRALRRGRLRLREAGVSEGGLVRRKALVDIDHPHSRHLATLEFSNDFIEICSTWPMVDSIVDELRDLGGTRVPPSQLARGSEGTIDYYSKYEAYGGGLKLSRETKKAEVFLIWDGFAFRVAEAMEAVSAELARAWEVACDEEATRAERRDAAHTVARWRGIEDAVRPVSINVDAYEGHTQACAADLGKWLAKAGDDDRGFDVDEL